MKKPTIALLAIVVIGLVGAAAYLPSRGRQTKQPTLEVSKSPTTASNASEQQFIEQMISHHADAIGMSQLAPGMAKSAEVKALANNILTAQQKEIDEMKTWYKSWYGKDIPEMSDMSGMSEESGKMMNNLRSANNFDLAFVTQMIPHHQSAVEMAKAILPRASQPEIKHLANSIISTQTEEIGQLQKLRQSL